MSINTWGINVSMLLSLLLAKIRILSCFFSLFLVIFINCLTIPVLREKNKGRLALAIPTGAPAILVNKIIDLILHNLLHLKQLKLGQDNQKFSLINLS